MHIQLRVHFMHHAAVSRQNGDNIRIARAPYPQKQTLNYPKSKGTYPHSRYTKYAEIRAETLNHNLIQEIKDAQSASTAFKPDALEE